MNDIRQMSTEEIDNVNHKDTKKDGSESGHSDVEELVGNPVKPREIADINRVNGSITSSFDLRDNVHLNDRVESSQGEIKDPNAEVNEFSSRFKLICIACISLIPLIKISLRDLDKYYYSSWEDIFITKIFRKLLKIQYTNDKLVFDKEWVRLFTKSKLYDTVNYIINGYLCTFHADYNDIDFMRLTKIVKRIINESDVNVVTRSNIYKQICTNYNSKSYFMDATWIENAKNKRVVKYIIDAYLTIILPN